MALAIDHYAGRVATIIVMQLLKGDRERGDANMVMSVMCKKIDEVSNDHPKRERRKISGEIARSNLDFLDGIENYLTNDHLIITNSS